MTKNLKEERKIVEMIYTVQGMGLKARCNDGSFWLLTYKHLFSSKTKWIRIDVPPIPQTDEAKKDD